MCEARSSAAKDKTALK